MAGAVLLRCAPTLGVNNCGLCHPLSGGWAFACCLPCGWVGLSGLLPPGLLGRDRGTVKENGRRRRGGNSLLVLGAFGVCEGSVCFLGRWGVVGGRATLGPGRRNCRSFFFFRQGGPAQKVGLKFFSR